MKVFESKLENHINMLMKRYPVLRCCRQEIIDAYILLKICFQKDGKLLVAGNGGSAADAEHITGELMKSFVHTRAVSEDFAEKLKSIDLVRGEKLAKNLERSLMTIPLVAHEALITAYINDVNATSVFAQQLFGYGRKGDVFLGISTSGNSANIVQASIVAQAIGMKVIGLTGQDGGELKQFADVVIRVPENETYKIQELHLPIYHCLCLMLEDVFFGI